MCNAFNTAKKPENIREAINEVGSKLIRRTDQAHVKLPTGELVPMKWGFQRKGLGVVNNTRSDNLESLMWKGRSRTADASSRLSPTTNGVVQKEISKLTFFGAPITITFGSRASGKKVRRSAHASPCSLLRRTPWSHRFTIACRQL